MIWPTITICIHNSFPAQNMYIYYDIVLYMFWRIRIHRNTLNTSEYRIASSAKSPFGYYQKENRIPFWPSPVLFNSRNKPRDIEQV